ncbi:MAG TPA: alpha-galactosidase [Phycisphaerae bacterium]|nr:alpha-galactosidase [Phycisphaerae bacterium]
MLDGGPATCVVGINERDELQHVYWGGRLWRDDDLAAARSFPQYDGVDPSTTTTPEEYPGWGGARFFEPCLKIALADGVRDIVLKYARHEIAGPDLIIRMKDCACDFEAALHYRMDVSGILRKHAVLTNNTAQGVTIESAQSGVWHLPAGGGYRLSYLTGRWGGETLLVQEDVHPGVKILESRRGVATSNQMNPWFALDGANRATERSGRVWFGALGWSGSWRLAIEQTPQQQVRVTGGYNPFDFAYPLQPGESLTTPPFFAGYTDRGFGEASRIMHQFQRDTILPRAGVRRPRPVLYNSWEATGFKVDEQGQMALAERAARLGVERFVMDDGWFGARDSSKAGLGDWTPSCAKFPSGLAPLIAHVRQLGMDFGIWVEPEMVNPDSDLYRAHPEWAIHFPGRPRSEARNQLVLNLAREDVKEHIFDALHALVSANDIRFLKWDANRHFTEPGWPERPVAQQRMIWVKYTAHYYEIIDRLRAQHPALEIESCSSGGGRVDLGILARTDQVWPSDNTDALDRLLIQDGFSRAYTPRVMMAWVTDVPNFNGRSTPLSFRFLVAMMGSLGIGANLTAWPEADLGYAAKMIAWYKSVRSTVQDGALFRLAPPGGRHATVNQYVSRDGGQSVVFALLHAQQHGRPQPAVLLDGLDPRAVYRVSSLDGKLAEKMESASGAYLLERGLTFELKGDFDGTAVVLQRMECGKGL